MLWNRKIVGRIGKRTTFRVYLTIRRFIFRFDDRSVLFLTIMGDAFLWRPPEFCDKKSCFVVKGDSIAGSCVGMCFGSCLYVCALYVLQSFGVKCLYCAEDGSGVRRCISIGSVSRLVVLFCFMLAATHFYLSRVRKKVLTVCASVGASVRWYAGCFGD